MLPSRRRGPPDVSARELFGLPPRVLLGPVIMTAGRIAVAQAAATACLVRNVVLEIAPPGRPAAARPGTRRVPDLGQVPQHDPGIMPAGLPPVVAVPGGDRADLDEQVLLPGGEPPGAVPARRAGLTGGGEGEPGAAGRIVPAGFAAFRRPGAAVADGVALAVGDGDAPGRPGVAGRGRARSRARSGSTGPIPPSSPGRSARPVTVASGTVKVTCPANPGGIIPASGPPGPGAGAGSWGWGWGWAGSSGRFRSWGWRRRPHGCRAAGSPCRAGCPGKHAPAAHPCRLPGPPSGAPSPTP